MRKSSLLITAIVLAMAPGAFAQQENLAYGQGALQANFDGTHNTALGLLSLGKNRSGSYNAALGRMALYNNIDGYFNTGVGDVALFNNTSGSLNVALGQSSLFNNTTGTRNTALGMSVLMSNTIGSENVANGCDALYSNTEGVRNTAIGNRSLNANTNGNLNVAVGFNALLRNIGGSKNIALGCNAGVLNRQGNENIYIGHPGQVNESKVIRIGEPQVQTRVFLAGVQGVTPSGSTPVAVMIDSNGQLGTVSSSIRFKQDVRDMGERTSQLYSLRPVTFRYKSQPAAEHFGLIAEEVAEVLPELVVRDSSGQIQTVAYHELAPMLLNEVQKQKKENDALKAEVARLRQLVEQVLVRHP